MFPNTMPLIAILVDLRISTAKEGLSVVQSIRENIFAFKVSGCTTLTCRSSRNMVC